MVVQWLDTCHPLLQDGCRIVNVVITADPVNRSGIPWLTSTSPWGLTGSGRRSSLTCRQHQWSLLTASGVPGLTSLSSLPVSSTTVTSSDTNILSYLIINCQQQGCPCFTSATLCRPGSTETSGHPVISVNSKVSVPHHSLFL